jgi:hypothetical protein
MTIHTLKTDPLPFDMVARDEKTFEIRKADRDFRRGDILELHRTEHDGEAMAGGAPLRYSSVPPLRVLVLSTMHGPMYGLEEGWCILSIVKFIGCNERLPA